jgi:hypothetical protein
LETGFCYTSLFAGARFLFGASGPIFAGRSGESHLGRRTGRFSVDAALLAGIGVLILCFLGGVSYFYAGPLYRRRGLRVKGYEEGFVWNEFSKASCDGLVFCLYRRGSWGAWKKLGTNQGADLRLLLTLLRELGQERVPEPAGDSN